MALRRGAAVLPAAAHGELQIAAVSCEALRHAPAQRIKTMPAGLHLRLCSVNLTEPICLSLWYHRSAAARPPRWPSAVDSAPGRIHSLAMPPACRTVRPPPPRPRRRRTAASALRQRRHRGWTGAARRACCPMRISCAWTSPSVRPRIPIILPHNPSSIPIILHPSPNSTSPLVAAALFAASRSVCLMICCTGAVAPAALRAPHAPGQAHRCVCMFQPTHTSAD